MDDAKLQEILDRATKLSASVPEPLREAAFNRIFDALFQEGSDSTTKAESTSKKKVGSTSGKRLGQQAKKTGDTPTDNNVAYLLENLDRTAIPQISTAPRVLDRALMLLRGVHDEYDIDGLSSTEIASLLTEKFRKKTSRQAVSYALDAAGGYVDRVQREGKVLYRIMEPGERFLDEQKSEVEGNSKAGSKKRHSSNKRKTSSDKQKNDATTQPSKKSGEKKRSTGISPTIAMRLLRDEGFFNSPRRIGAIQEHLKHSKGYQFAVTALSPALVRMVRADLLERTRAEDGQYEYKRK